MKKSIVLFALIFIAALTICATTSEELIGRWYVQSMEMRGEIEEFNTESEAPWMEFQEEGVLLLGEADREPKVSGWTFDEELNLLFLDSFGEEIPFEVKEITEDKLTLQAVAPDESIVTLILKHHL